MPGKGQKMIFHRKRFCCEISIRLENLPIGTRDAVKLLEPTEFYTLKDISELTRIPYHTVRDIYKGSSKGKKWANNPLCPTVTITAIDPE